jgi:hypothetical protein
LNTQNRNVKTAKTASTARTIGIAFPLVLAIIMAVLFGKSFLPGYCHFSNDGPLGEQMAAWGRFPQSLTGVWDDLNDIGNNSGASAPDVTVLLHMILGPVGFAKFLAPIALFTLGLGAWTFFRQLKLSPLAAALGGLATALNSGFFGDACWGTAPHQFAIAAVFFSLALVMANSDETRPLIRGSRLALAGMCLGINVIEGADIGAILSMFVAAFVFLKSLLEEDAPVLHRAGRGVGRVAVIAVFAGLIAAQTVTSLIGTNITNAAGMGDNKDVESKQEHWDWATEWSLPKTETLGVVVPGVFGYKMDTPKDMMSFLQPSYSNGEYWGGMGRTPAIDRYFDSGSQGSPPPGMMRFGYAGYYAGILVALMALFAFVQSLRRQNSVFSQTQKYFIWFWMVILVMSILLSWGRFAPFYQFLYGLPYFSTIRNPAKFMVIFYIAMIIIFAYGIDALSRRYLQVPDTRASSQSKNWWENLRGFDRNWSIFCIITFAVSALAWLCYSGQQTAMVSYLGKIGFPDVNSATAVFAFSVGQCEWFLLFFAVAVLLVILALAGVFSGKRAGLGGLLLGALLVVDMGRANLPWIIHWDYLQKYDIDPKDSYNSTNPIINFLRDKPYEHRVTDLPSQTLLENVYRIEWMQHHFPYYNIQCSDIIQSPRVASDLAAYDMALAPSSATSYLVARKWQLTNTRYLFGPAGYLNSVNDQLDPAQRRFQIFQRFNIVPKSGVDVEKLQEAFDRGEFEGEKLTAVPDPNGDYAILEFTGALPRAKLYSNWQVMTNNDATLQTLASQNFDPEKTVLVSTSLPGAPMDPANENSGTVDYKSYAPKTIVLAAQADKPSVLLLNDKFDPGWQVSVDEKPATLLRCNFIMRGVFLPSGSHTVEFQFSAPHGPLYITLVSMGAGILLCGFLFFSIRKPPQAAKLDSQNSSAQAGKAGRASAGNRRPSSEPVRPTSH